MQETIAQSGTSLSGTWSTTFTNAGNNSATLSGTLTGSISGSSVSMSLVPSAPTSCTIPMTATVSGNSMSGTYVSANCSVPDSGSINLTEE